MHRVLAIAFRVEFRVPGEGPHLPKPLKSLSGH